MIKRITSALLALLILVSGLPIGVGASEIGDTVAMPAKENPGSGWEPDEDNWVQRGCDLEGHVHDASCVSPDNVLICEIPEGTHIHDQNCGYFDIQYQWIYTGKATNAAVKAPFSLTVRNVDPQGNPVVAGEGDSATGAKFYIINPGLNNQSVSKTADSNGEAEFTYARVDDSKAESELTLYQNAIKADSDLGKLYKHNPTKYTLKITKKNGQYLLSIPEAEADGKFDPETGVLTFVNEPRMGMLTVKMDLEYPEGMEPEGAFTVKVNEEAMALTADNAWKTPLSGLEWGAYTITLENAELAEGYELSNVSYKVQPYNGDETASEDAATVDLAEDSCTAATVVITGKVKKSMPKYVEIRTEDTQGNLLGGATAGIFLRETSTGAMEEIGDTDKDGVISIDVGSYIGDAAAMLGEGESRTVWLKQVSAPEGYERSATTFALTATKLAGELNYEIPGAVLEGDTMKLSFVHEAKMGTVDVQMVFAKDVIPDTVTQIPVTITGGSTNQELILSAENGWKAQLELPLGTYTVVQKDEAAQAEDYTLTTTYENQTLTLANHGDRVTCTIANQYYTASNTIIVRATDEKDTLLKNISLNLQDESGNAVRTYTCNGGELYLTDLEELAQEGQSVTYLLCPENADYSGYETAQQQYRITVKESNGRVTVRAQKNTNFLVRLFSDGVEEGTNGEQIIAFTYEAIRGAFTVKMELTGDVPPVEAITASIVGLEQNPLTETLEFTAANNWQVTLEDVPMGVYAILPETETETYKLANVHYLLDNCDPLGDLDSGIKICLDETEKRALLTIGAFYIKLEDSIPSTVELRSQDAKGNPLTGFKVGVFMSATATGALEEIGDDDNDGLISINVDEYLADISAMLTEGKSRTVYLKQSAAPEGYAVSETVFELTATKRNGEIEYEIPGAELAEDVMKLSFVNTPVPSDKAELVIKMNVSGEGAPAKIPVTVTGEKGSETFELSAENQWTVSRKDLAKDAYTITQDALVSGYMYTSTYQVEGGSFTDGVLTMEETAAKVTLTITNTYEKEKINTLVIKVQDDLGNALPGAAVGLFYGENDLSQFGIGPFQDKDDGAADGLIVIDDLKGMVDMVSREYEALLTTLGSLKLTLKQASRPDAMKKDSNSIYEINVKKVSDGVEYGITGVASSNGDAEIPLVYEVDKGTLVVQAVMNGAPESLKEITVTVTDSANKERVKSLTLTRDKQWKGEIPLPVSTYEIAQTAEAEGYTLKAEFNPTTKRVRIKANSTESVTITNTYTEKVDTPVVQTAKLTVQMKFKESTGTSSVDMTVLPASVKATVSGGNQKRELTFTEAGKWTQTVELPLGSYKVDVDETTGTVAGYQLKVEEPAQLTLTEQGGILTITNLYTKQSSDQQKETIKVDPNGKLKIRTVDSKGKLWGGAKYGLYYGANEIRAFTDYGTGVIDVNNPELVMGIYTESLIALGAPMTLKQTRAPSSSDGLSERVYTVYLVWTENDEVGLEVEGAEVSRDGTQIVEFTNTKTPETEPEPVNDTDDSGIIVIRTLDDAGNTLSGAEYCLSADQYYDADEDVIYKDTDRHGEIRIENLAQLVENGKKSTWYLMQSRQPDNSKLSSDRFKVELSKKGGKLEVVVKKDEGLLDVKTAGTVEEGDNGEWIVTFVSNQKTTTVNVTCTEVVNWNDCVVVEDVLQGYKQSEYEFIMNWELDGEKQESKRLKLRNGETGSFEPIPNGARYEVLIPEEICAKGVFKKGQRIGTAVEETVELEAELTYQIVTGDPLTIDMLRIDAQTESPLSGAVYTLKDGNGEEMDTYKTRGDGKFLVDAITAPGEYTLTETETPQGYSKIKKPIAVNVALAFEEGTDAKGNPVIRQKLEAEVSHSMVKQLESGTYRIGTAQEEGGNTVVIIAAAAAAAVAAGGTGAMLLRRRRRSGRT